MIDARGIAAAMAQSLSATAGGFDRRALVVPIREVEADGPAAARARVAVAGLERPDARGFLQSPVFAWIDQSDQRRHVPTIEADDYHRVTRRAGSDHPLSAGGPALLNHCMADISAEIETLENRWMRAWVQRDARTLKSLTAASFIFLSGSKPPAILDQKSWLEAATKRWLCTSFRFGEPYVRQFGGLVLFAARVDLESTIDGADQSGMFWVTDLWRKGRIRRGWRLAQRVVSRIDDDAGLPAAVRALQLWKSAGR